MKKVNVFILLCLLSLEVSFCENKSQPSWLSDAVVYQIYPSSFQDSDGDGIGDLPGIISRLEYIKSIGVTAIWINPIFVSGWQDGGYDVIDYYKIDPRFGDNSDLVKLIEKAHSLNLKVILDLVAGHTSDQSEWFLQSKEEDPNLRYSDYYIWPTFLPEVNSSANSNESEDYSILMNPLNNIINKFVKSDAPRAPYYIKNFFDSQPALNFGFANPNPKHPWEQSVNAPGPMSVRREIKNIMQFWMDKGIDGFRVDMAASLVKNDFDKTETIKLWKEDLAKWFKMNYPENLLIAEWFNPAQSIEAGFNIDFFCHDGKYNYSTLFFYGGRERSNSSNIPPYFDLEGKGSIKTWYDLYSYQYNSVKGKGYVSMPSGNHDFNRLSTGIRTTSDQLKVAMTFFLTMPGIPFIYYGDEIGLKQNPRAQPVEGSFSRAGTRIPMLWDDTKNAGFSNAPKDKLYIAQDSDPNRITVAKSELDPNSLLNYVRFLIKLRENHKALGADADWELISSLDKPYPMIYNRTLNNKKYLVVLNPSNKTVTAKIPFQGENPTILGGIYKKASYKKNRRTDIITISPVSAVIYKL